MFSAPRISRTAGRKCSAAAEEAEETWEGSPGEAVWVKRDARVGEGWGRAEGST